MRMLLKFMSPPCRHCPTDRSNRRWRQLEDRSALGGGLGITLDIGRRDAHDEAGEEPEHRREAAAIWEQLVPEPRRRLFGRELAGADLLLLRPDPERGLAGRPEVAGPVDVAVRPHEPAPVADLDDGERRRPWLARR